MRRNESIDYSWKFKKADTKDMDLTSLDTRDWEEVNLPHTWNAVDGANGFEYFKGLGLYQKEIYVNADLEGRRAYIEFLGANSIADIYVNGQHQGQHKGGYSTFRFDITDALVFGQKNMLTVQVDNTVVDDIYPLMADFTFFGGLYRGVNLIYTNHVHVDLMDEGSSGVYIIQDNISEEEAGFTLKTLVKNDKKQASKVRVWVEVFDAEQNLMTYGSREVFLDEGQQALVTMPMSFETPILWNGLDHPYMYTVKVRLESYNEVVDEVEVKTGFRFFDVDAEKGFSLNGKLLRLNGVSRHQDRMNKGWAISESDQREDMELIKEVGATSIRLAHYQHNQYFYDLCDQEGMVIWAEIPFISVMSKMDLEGTNAKQQMVELIRQNFNHPSICFWGVQNEIQIGGERPEVRQVVKELNELTKLEDPTRLTTMANVMMVEDADDYNYMTDVIGYNKYYGWYNGQAEDFASWLDGFHALNPQVKLGISEYGAEGIIQYHSDNPEIKDYTEEYHALYHETVWKIFQDRKYLWSTYVWNMFDFGANIRDEGGVQGRNNKGLVTYDRKVKKDAFYMYKAHWSQEKFVHITSKRFVERATDQINVKVYTNCDQLSLYVNGQEFETSSDKGKVAVFENISLADGVNTIKVIGGDVETNETYTDTGFYIKVDKANPSYLAPEEKGSIVSNWFDMPDTEESETEVGELVFPEGVYSIKTPLGKLVENPETNEIIKKYLGDIAQRPMYGMMEGFNIQGLAEMDKKVFTGQFVYLINNELIKIPNK